MSLIGSGVSLTHRCTVERDVNADSDDGWGNPLPPFWEEHIADLRCRGWTAGHETVTDKGTLTVLIEVRLLVPLGSDITEHDRVSSVSERGTTIHDGPLAVHAVLARRDHLELILSKAA